MGIRDDFARNLRSRRRAKGLSQEELAHRAEIDRTYISALERRIYGASIDVVDRLARELGVEAADLLIRSPRDKRATIAGGLTKSDAAPATTVPATGASRRKP